MVAENLAIGRDQLARGLGDGFALLFEIGGDELLVVTAGNEADLLRVRLLGERKAALRGHFAHLRLRHSAERKEGMRQLLLRESEKEIGLILCQIRGALEDPAARVPGCTR